MYRLVRGTAGYIPTLPWVSWTVRYTEQLECFRFIPPAFRLPPNEVTEMRGVCRLAVALKSRKHVGWDFGRVAGSVHVTIEATLFVAR